VHEQLWSGANPLEVERPPYGWRRASRAVPASAPAVVTEPLNERPLSEWESEGGSLERPAFPPGRVKVPPAGAADGTIIRRIGAIIALLCGVIFGRLWLHLSFGTLLTVAASLCVFVMLRELWVGERAYRANQRARDEHFIREYEDARARLRELGD